MTPQRLLFAVSVTLLASCADMMPYGQQGYPQQNGGYYGQQPVYNNGGYVPPGYQQPQQQPQGGYYPPQQQQPTSYPQPRPPAQSDYLPHLSQEYRSGYDIGTKDRQMGYPRDHRRAYERFGRGYESYFQEGYADGYDGRPIQH